MPYVSDRWFEEDERVCKWAKNISGTQDRRSRGGGGRAPGGKGGGGVKRGHQDESAEKAPMNSAISNIPSPLQAMSNENPTGGFPTYLLVSKDEERNTFELFFI